jgi:hypothetical protein
MPFPDHQISVKPFPHSPGNGISETLNSKISRGDFPRTSLEKPRTCCARLVPSALVYQALQYIGAHNSL